jgi:hypothetical protein
MDTERLKKMLLLTRCSKRTTVLACDELPEEKPVANTAFIVNLQESWRRGNHWIVLYIVDDHHVELFDSLVTSAERTNIYISNFIKMFRSFEKNAGTKLQDSVSESCGLYCVYFIYHRCMKKNSMKKIIRKLFTDDPLMNECLVIAFCNKLYNKNLFSHVAHTCPP